MALPEDLERIAAAAAAHASPGERLTGVLAAEPLGAGRLYLCAYESGDGHTWLVLDDEGGPIESRRIVREGATLAALCEVAEDSAGGGHLPELRARLAELRERDAPEGIEEAEEAAAALEQTLQPAPRPATTAYLDALGAASRRLEHALGEDAGSPFAAALRQAAGAVEELAAEVERRYKLPLAD
jgi:HPt (histidine-containing phosphotransfer) domain-containing protein